uniref:Ig-like domain-containing protein n=1 Tax=Podarcis muralis TaxID=64176 RepID=A0A670K3H6_PODMU
QFPNKILAMPMGSGASTSPPPLTLRDTPFFFLPPPAEHFLFQLRQECHFSNGTQRIRFLDRYFFDRQELLYFDSDRGKFVAVAELGEPDVERANQDKNFLRSRKAAVDRFCQHNYGIFEPLSQARHVQPKVKITRSDSYPSSPHNTQLTCKVSRFFPAGIDIKWFKNGKEEPKVWTIDHENGDWTFNTELILETNPERGDVYTCQVEHASFEGPVTVKWGRTPSYWEWGAFLGGWVGCSSLRGLIPGLPFLTLGFFFLQSHSRTLPGARCGRGLWGLCWGWSLGPLDSPFT